MSAVNMNMFEEGENAGQVVVNAGYAVVNTEYTVINVEDTVIVNLPPAPAGFAAIRNGAKEGAREEERDKARYQARLRIFADEITAGVLDGRSWYNKCFEDKGYLKPSNWKSSKGERGFFLFKDKEVSGYLENLFRMVEQETAKKGPVKMILARNNLFHGHVMYDPGSDEPESDDIRIVFHALEYPEDLEMAKAAGAKVVEGEGGAFKAEDSQFQWRNAVYSWRKNRLYIIDATCPRYATLIGSAMTLQEEAFGVQQYDLNFFPREGLPVFIA